MAGQSSCAGIEDGRGPAEPASELPGGGGAVPASGLPGGLGRRSVLLLVGLAALLPILPFLGAGPIAEDASILGRVQRMGALGDWFGPQYGLRIVRFWRPLVTTSWWAQLEFLGPHPATLRLLNLLCHVGVALGIVLLVRAVLDAKERRGPPPWAALVAGLAVAFFPHQGGTLLWLSGRTDLLAALFLVLGCLAGLRARWALAFVLVFLSCASKEFGFEAPVWVLALCWARPAAEGERRLLRPVLLLGAAVLGAFLWRGLALGTFVGGYAGAEIGGPAGLLRAFVTFARGTAPLLGGALLAGLLGALAGTLRPRLFLVGLVLSFLGFLPLVPLASDGLLEPQNQRLLFVPEIALCLALAASVARSARPSPARLALSAILLGLLGWRGTAAVQDLGAWNRSADLAATEVASARALVAKESPSEVPVLVAHLPATLGPAYCLNWGVADRFRAPFPATPRPIWPLRPLFFRTGAAPEMASFLDEAGNLWPLREPRRAPGLEARFVWEGAPGHTTTALVLSEASLDGSEPCALSFAWPASVAGGPPAASFEAVVFTELGYHAVPLGLRSLGSSSEAAAPAFLPLPDLLAATDGVANLGQALLQAADTGARGAFLELRALDAEGELLAASTWLELRWDDELVGVFLGS